jgi:hypothetical protein
MAENYKNFILNQPGESDGWGTAEEQNFKDVIDTVVGDAITQAKDTAGHKHSSLYKPDGTKVIDTGSGVATFQTLPVVQDGEAQKNIATETYVNDSVSVKQDALINSGESQNIKTINDEPILGVGNIVINGGAYDAINQSFIRQINDASLFVFVPNAKWGHGTISYRAPGGDVYYMRFTFYIDFCSTPVLVRENSLDYIQFNDEGLPSIDFQDNGIGSGQLVVTNPDSQARKYLLNVVYTTTDTEELV